MKAVTNVVSMAHPTAEQLDRQSREARLRRPEHFRTKALRTAWDDLTGAVALDMLTVENRFTFEFAALLTAKMRSGKPMTATESKELKRYLVQLGLAKGDDDRPPEGKRKTARFFDTPPR